MLSIAPACCAHRHSVEIVPAWKRQPTTNADDSLAPIPYGRAVQSRIALYDLDRTALATPTFTSFLLFAARRDARWRLLLLPIWILAMLAHAMKFYDRDVLKPLGISLFIGRRIDQSHMQSLASAFADTRIPNDIQPGALAAMQADEANGYTLVLATAAPEFYACELGRRMGFQDVLATRHCRADNGDWLPAILGTNCYRHEKRRRIDRWLVEAGVNSEEADIRFYSDDLSDAPTLELANQGFAVNPNRKFARAADLAGWTIVDFRIGPSGAGER